MRTLRLLPFLLLLLTAVALAACGDASADAERLARRLEVEGFAYERHTDGARVVTGKLYNPSSQSIRNAMVSVALYDAQNRRIGTLRVPVQEVPAGERRSFREVVDMEGVQGARIHSVLVM